MSWTTVWYVVPWSSPWMAWNLLLALIPMGLSFWLLHGSTLPHWLRGAIALGFVTFLPNAPYVLTDLIHLVQEIQWNESLMFNTLILLPKYSLFVLLGFEAYVISLLNIGKYLTQRSQAPLILPAELLLHWLSSVGIYLGRVERFNSWDIVTQPALLFQHLTTHLATRQALLFIAIGFGIITLLYGGMKHITVALQLQREYHQTFKNQALKNQALKNQALKN